MCTNIHTITHIGSNISLLQEAYDALHLQLQGSHVQLSPHLQPPSSAATPISAPSNWILAGPTPKITVSVVSPSA